MLNKKINRFFLVMTVLFFWGFVLAIPITHGANFNYQPMENIPGTEDISTFPKYVEAIFKFAVWTIGIAALLMLIIGGFMYITAAGNTSTMEKAKDVIRDAILGVLAVILAYLLLFVINPDLVNINLDSLSPSNLKGETTNNFNGN